MNGIRRCEVTLTEKLDQGSARALGPIMMKLTDDDFLINDANQLLTGLSQSDRGQVITVMMVRDPGKMPHGMGLIYQLGVDEAREIAAGLIELADEVEAAAATQAAAAIDAARAKRS